MSLYENPQNAKSLMLKISAALNFFSFFFFNVTKFYYDKM